MLLGMLDEIKKNRSKNAQSMLRQLKETGSVSKLFPVVDYPIDGYHANKAGMKRTANWSDFNTAADQYDLGKVRRLFEYPGHSKKTRDTVLADGEDAPDAAFFPKEFAFSSMDRYPYRRNVAPAVGAGVGLAGGAAISHALKGHSKGKKIAGAALLGLGAAGLGAMRWQDDRQNFHMKNQYVGEAIADGEISDEAVAQAWDKAKVAEMAHVPTKGQSKKILNELAPQMKKPYRPYICATGTVGNHSAGAALGAGAALLSSGHLEDRAKKKKKGTVISKASLLSGSFRK